MSLVVRNSMVPRLVSWFFPVAAITIGPIIFVKSGHEKNLSLLVHEEIHVLQGRELYYIGFWWLYFRYWFSALLELRDPHAAYLAIPFEREAREHQGDICYLARRPPMAWKKYI